MNSGQVKKPWLFLREADLFSAGALCFVLAVDKMTRVRSMGDEPRQTLDDVRDQEPSSWPSGWASVLDVADVVVSGLRKGVTKKNEGSLDGERSREREREKGVDVMMTTAVRTKAVS